MRTHSFSAVKNQQPYQFLRATGLFLLLVFFIVSCGDDRKRRHRTPTEYAQTLCDCIKEDALEHATDLTKCYQDARNLREKNLHTDEAKKEFDKVAFECAGAGFLDFLIKSFK
jgi:hypothetical protein